MINNIRGWLYGPPENPIIFTGQQKMICLYTILIILAVSAVLIWIFRDKLRNNQKADRIIRITMIVIGINYLTYNMFKYQYDYNVFIPIGSLPLEMCSFAAMIFILVFWKEDLNFLLKWAFHIGMIATLLAFLLYAGDIVFNAISFWDYVIGHSAIFLGYIYLLFVKGYSINWKDTVKGSIALVVIAFTIIVPFNMLTDRSYFFLGPNETNGVITSFGEWPNRLLPIMVTLFFVMALCTGIAYLLSKYGPKIIKE